jgi:hypothetical protein
MPLFSQILFNVFFFLSPDHPDPCTIATPATLTMTCMSRWILATRLTLGFAHPRPKSSPRDLIFRSARQNPCSVRFRVPDNPAPQRLRSHYFQGPCHAHCFLLPSLVNTELTRSVSGSGRQPPLSIFQARPPAPQ